MKPSATNNVLALLALAAATTAAPSDTPARPSAIEEAAADHARGMTLRRPGGEAALAAALPWLEHAVRLDPNNADYVGDLAGTCLQLADFRRSYFLAVKGRDGLEAAVRLNPNDLEARSGLMEFYARAPWPLGDIGKARDEAREIGRRKPESAADTLLRLAGFLEQRDKRSDALDAYREALKIDPGNRKAQDGIARLQ